MTPDDASREGIRRFELDGLGPAKAKELMWRYVLALQVAKYVVGHAQEAHAKAGPASVESLRRFLAANGEAADFTLHEKFWRMIGRLKSSLSLEAFGVKVGVAVDAPTAGLKTNNQLEVVEAGVAAALRDLRCGDRHGGPLLLVDQLEGIWANDTDSDAMIIGLLLAAKDVRLRRFSHALIAVEARLLDDVAHNR